MIKRQTPFFAPSPVSHVFALGKSERRMRKTLKVPLAVPAALSGCEKHALFIAHYTAEGGGQVK